MATARNPAVCTISPPVSPSDDGSGGAAHLGRLCTTSSEANVIGITLLPMTPNWLVDPSGRRLPEASWPPERRAPGDLELVRRFCNTINRENGADRFATAVGFDQWLRGEGRRRIRPSRGDLARVVGFRESLHAITCAN